MKKFLTASFLCFGLFFSGCGGMDFTIRDNIPQVLQEDPVKGAQYALDELNASAIAVARSLKANQPFLAKEDYNTYKAAMLEANVYLNKTNYFIQLGKVDDANQYLGLARSAINLVKAELAKKAGNQ